MSCVAFCNVVINIFNYFNLIACNMFLGKGLVPEQKNEAQAPDVK